jgi:hypothetical protein
MATGFALLGIGSTGLALFHLEVQRQQEESRTLAALEAKKNEEQQAYVEELKRQLDDEKFNTLETQRKLLVERRMRDEDEARYKRDIKALETKISRQSPRADRTELNALPGMAESRQGRIQKPQEPTRFQNQSKGNVRSDDGPSATALKHSRNSITIRMNLDPLRTTELKIAHVHVNDKVRIRVGRPEGDRSRIYAGLSPLGFLADASQREYLAAWAGPPPQVILPVADNDRFSILSPANLDPVLGGTLSTREGAILTVALGSRSREAMGFHGRPLRRGVYEIEVTIETNNRWNIPPRSLL